MEYILVNNKYNILNQIGAGNFGTIYKGENIRTKEQVAIKVEPIKHNYKMLKNEATIYQYLLHSYGVPKLKWFGKDETNYYLVMSLLGKSLEHYIQERGTFSLDLTLKIGVQILHLLKHIHDNGLIHRDIKPENFLFGMGEESNQLFLIDFGLSKTYIDYDNNEHIKIKTSKNVIGTPTYVSVNGHNFLELSRRDDLESLGYMMVYMYYGKLKWQNIKGENTNGLIKRAKEKIKELYNLPKEIEEYLEEVLLLKYRESPDYEELKLKIKRSEKVKK